MVVYIQQFFETLLGVSLPEWFFNTLGLLLCMMIIRSMISLMFPKLTKYSETVILWVTLGYMVYNVCHALILTYQGG